MQCLTRCLDWGKALINRSCFYCTILLLSHPQFQGGLGGSDSKSDHSVNTISPCSLQGSSSSDSLEGQSCDYASKSYDAVVFDVLKVTPEEFAVSETELVWVAGHHNRALEGATT